MAGQGKARRGMARMKGKNMKKGKFIVFEGIDGAGKTTMNRKAVSFLHKNGINCQSIKFPSDDIECVVYDEMTEALAHIADQYSYRRAINNMTGEGLTVVSDRFTPSVYAYQVSQAPEECCFETIKTIEKAVLGDFKPDQILLFDLPADIAFFRVKERDSITRFDNKVAKQLDDARKMYLRLAREDPDRYIIIDANTCMSNVWQQVQTELEKIFNLK